MNSILPESTIDRNKEISIVLHFFKKHQVGKALRQSNFLKERGIPCNDLLQFLVMLVFTGKNLFRYLQAYLRSIPFAKDTIYRFLNNCHYN